MPVQRKLFRIEEMMRAQLQPRVGGVHCDAPLLQAEILAEMRAMRSLLEARAAAIAEAPRNILPQTAVEMRKLKIELDVIGDAIKQTRTEIVSLQDQGFDSSRVARVTKEIEAVAVDTSSATDRILKAAEQIDESANALLATLKNCHEKGLAQDIHDQVTGIFEACNFHDLTGQRISKVATTLRMVEDHLARMMEIWSVIERFNVDAMASAAENLDGLLNGPKLDGDQGHSTQDEIDALFH